MRMTSHKLLDDFLRWRAVAGKDGYCGAENISSGHYKNGSVFFSVMSRNAPDKVIFVESSPGEKLELAVIPPAQQKSTDLVAKRTLYVVA
ncbi:hypothetical protein TNCV_4622331 [Trichonephila clavipes]|nr:hypothetical protein TNCV_4622331 [Trichonephila clavipes]